MSADYMVSLSLSSFGGIRNGVKTDKGGSGGSKMSMGKAGKMGKGGSMMSMGKAGKMGKGGSMMSMGKAGKSSPSTSQPTKSPTCQSDNGLFKSAVALYISQNCKTNSSCAIGETYGHPIGKWCTSYITSMNALFSGMT
jgi:hypothetical protein